MGDHEEGVAVRVNRGRQRVEMVKMENESNLQVTFSKRRAGLFKKASELCTLCGAEMALVVFSPGNKVFSFGHPSVHAVLARYAGESSSSSAGGVSGAGAAAPAAGLVEAHRSAALRELNVRLAGVTAEVEAERRRGDEMARARREAAGPGGEWWQGPVDGIRCEARLRSLGRALRELKIAVAAQTDRIVVQTVLPPPPPPPPQPPQPFYGVDQGFDFLAQMNVDFNNIVAGIAPPFAAAGNDDNNNRFGYGGGHGFY